MGQQPRPKDAKVPHDTAEIPHEVAGSQGLNQPTDASVPIDPVGPGCHVLSLLVHEQGPQCQDVDHATLYHGDDVHIPVDPRPSIEALIVLFEEGARECRRDDSLYKLVCQGSAQYFVDMVWQGGEVEAIGEGFHVIEKRRRRGWERVEHGGIVSDGLYECRSNQF